MAQTLPQHKQLADPLPTPCTAGRQAAAPPRHGFLASLPRKREAVRQFTPSWFTVCMGTGSLGLTISAFPFPFPGQQGIGLALWCLTCLLFVLFCCLLLGRLLAFPSTVRHMVAHPNQSLFLGALPMAFSTITNGVIAFGVPRFGASAAAAAHALFWANMPAVLGCILFMPIAMVTTHEQSMHSMTALWLLPVVPACVAANSAGVVALRLPAEQALPVLSVGICLLGIGFLLSVQICTIYYQRLVCHSLPAREMIISSFLPVGPMGMTAWAAMNLAAGANAHLTTYASGHPEWRVDADWLSTVLPFSTVLAGAVGMFLWGFASWWLLLALVSISTTLKQGIPFNLGWWGSVFPVGVYTGATITLGQVVHARVFLILGAVAVCCHALLWLVVMALTLRRGWTGQLFHAPCLAAGPAVACPGPAAEVERRLSAHSLSPAAGVAACRAGSEHANSSCNEGSA